MSSTPVVPTTTTPIPTPDQQAPTASPIDLSDIPNHVEHAWEDVKNLFETGDTTGHPEETNRAEKQAMVNQGEMNQGQADYKNFLYKSAPDEFKQAYPAEYLYRKAYNTVHQAITEPAEHMLTGKAREEIAPKIDELTEAGLGAATMGLVRKPGEAEPVIDTSVIPNPAEGVAEGMEEGAAGAEFHGDRINLAKTPNPKPTPKAPEAPAPRVDLSDIPGVKTIQHPVEITMHGPSWDRTHRMNVNGERAGSIGYHVDPDGTARIYGAHVPEHMRGQGIGQEGYKSIFKVTEADPKIKRIQSDPTHISPAATHAWEAMQRKGEYPIENITHANGQPGFQIDFKREAPGEQNGQTEISGGQYRAGSRSDDGSVEETKPRTKGPVAQGTGGAQSPNSGQVTPVQKKDVPNGKAPADSMGQKAASLPDSAASGPTKTNPNIKPSAVVDPKIQKTVEDAGGVYRGQNKDGLVEITLSESVTKDLPISDVLKKHVSVNLHANEVTPEAVKGAIDRKLTEFGGKTMARKALAKD